MHYLADSSPYLPEVWLELFSLYNENILPFQIVTAVFALGILFTATSGRAVARKLTTIGLGVCWMFVAIAYHYLTFTSINWLAYGFSILFLIQGLLLIAVGVISRHSQIENSRKTNPAARIFLLLIALAVIPVTGLIDGRLWDQIDLFGVGPDSTAVVTVGFLLATKSNCKWWLTVIPVVWMIISFFGTWPFGMYQGLVGLAFVLALVLYFCFNHLSSKTNG